MLRRLYDTIVGRCSDEGGNKVALITFIGATESSILSAFGDWRDLTLPAAFWTLYSLTRAGNYLQNQNERNGIVRYRE